MSVQQAEKFEQIITARIPDDEDKVLARIAYKYGVVGHSVRFLYIVWKLFTKQEE